MINGGRPEPLVLPTRRERRTLLDQEPLHSLEVGGGVGEGGGAVPEVVQPHRREPGQLDEAVETAGQPVRVQWGAVIRSGEYVAGVLLRVVGRALFGSLPAWVGA